MEGVVEAVAVEGDIGEVITEVATAAMQWDIFREVTAQIFTQEIDVIYVIQD